MLILLSGSQGVTLKSSMFLTNSDGESKIISWILYSGGVGHNADTWPEISKIITHGVVFDNTRKDKTSSINLFWWKFILKGSRVVRRFHQTLLEIVSKVDWTIARFNEGLIVVVFARSYAFNHSVLQLFGDNTQWVKGSHVIFFAMPLLLYYYERKWQGTEIILLNAEHPLKNMVDRVIPEEKAASRKSSTNSKKEEILTELQQEKKAFSTDTSEDNPKIQALEETVYTGRLEIDDSPMPELEIFHKSKTGIFDEASYDESCNNTHGDQVPLTKEEEAYRLEYTFTIHDRSLQRLIPHPQCCQEDLQTIVATSTTEAEYVAAANCCGQVLHSMDVQMKGRRAKVLAFVNLRTGSSFYNTSKSSGEEQMEDKSPNTHKAANSLQDTAKKAFNTSSIKLSTVSEQVSTGNEQVSTVSAKRSTPSPDKGQRAGKAPMIIKETPKKIMDMKVISAEEFSFEEVKEEFDKLVKQVESFAPINFEATKASLKRFGEELQTKTSKRLKSDEAKDDDQPSRLERRKQCAEERIASRHGG
ncbi:hypothetical protein Tco_0218140 [Tanacetum coccineum]